LDAFGIGSGTKKAQKTAGDELQSLINSAREERSALSEMLTQVTTRGTKLAQTHKALEQIEKTAAGTMGKVDELGRRLTSLDERTSALEDVDKKIKTLHDTVRQAQQAAERVVGPEGDLQKHREALNQLSSQTLQTQASFDTLKKDRASLEDLRSQLRQTQGDLKQSLDSANALKTELDQVRSAGTILGQDYARLREMSREAREDSGAAMEAVKDVEKRMGPSRSSTSSVRAPEERLTSLNALAEHVTHKAKALESQKHTIDHAVVEANRLNEMVWSMDAQIAKLNEGNKQIARTEENLARMEKLATETSSQLDSATKAKDELARELARVEKDGHTLNDSIRGHVDRLTVEKKEFEIFDQRLRVLQASVGEAEGRMESLAAKDKNLAQLNQRVDVLATRYQELFAQSGRPEQETRSPRVPAMRGSTRWMSSPNEPTHSSPHSTRAAATSRCSGRKSPTSTHRTPKPRSCVTRSRQNRAALESFMERVTALNLRTPEIEAKMDAIQSKFGLIEEGTQKAARVSELASELDGQVNRVAARLQFVEQVEARLNGLGGVLAEVEQKLNDQLGAARRGRDDQDAD
jgi:chromosome segregation ATPase